MEDQPQHDVVIIGAGAAGLSAALYSVRAMLKTVVLEKFAPGGQILYTGDIENYPGFPQGIKGPELAELYDEQARRFGAEIVIDNVTRLDVTGPVKRVIGEEGEYTAKAVIIASGGEHNPLGVPGEETFASRGVSYCATCDGNFFRDMDVAVVGGGDAAIGEGLYLTNMVSKVTVVHRRDQLRASRILQERAFQHPKVDFLWNTVVQEIRGNGEMDRLLLKDLKHDTLMERPFAGVFIYIGFHPCSEYLKGVVEMDNGGHVVSNIRMETGVPGVFVAGDIRQYSDRQLGTAVGDGVTAALCAYNYITAFKP